MVHYSPHKSFPASAGKTAQVRPSFEVFCSMLLGTFFEVCHDLVQFSLYFPHHFSHTHTHTHTRTNTHTHTQLHAQTHTHILVRSSRAQHKENTHTHTHTHTHTRTHLTRTWSR